MVYEKMFRDESFKLNGVKIAVDVSFSEKELYEKNSIDIMEEVKELLTIIGDDNISKIKNPDVSQELTPSFVQEIEIPEVLKFDVQLYKYPNNYYVKIVNLISIKFGIEEQISLAAKLISVSGIDHSKIGKNKLLCIDLDSKTCSFEQDPISTAFNINLSELKKDFSVSDILEELTKLKNNFLKFEKYWNEVGFSESDFNEIDFQIEVEFYDDKLKIYKYPYEYHKELFSRISLRILNLIALQQEYPELIKSQDEYKYEEILDAELFAEYPFNSSIELEPFYQRKSRILHLQFWKNKVGMN